MCCPPPVLSNIAFEVGVCASSCASHAYISKRFWERPPQDISNSADAVATSTGPCWCDGLPLGHVGTTRALHSHAIDAGVRYETSEMRDVPALFLGALSIQQLYSWMLSIVVCVCSRGKGCSGSFATDACGSHRPAAAPKSHPRCFTLVWGLPTEAYECK